MRVTLLIAASGLIALSACQQTTTAPSAAASTATGSGTSAPADAQLVNGAQTRLNRYGFNDVDANTLTRDQIIRLNRIDTIRRGPAEIRLEINAILARSQ